MAATFNLGFKYTISYKPSDVLYFGINLLLGSKEFPLRLSGTATGRGDDKSPRSTGTFNFSGMNNQFSIDSTRIFDPTGLSDIDRDMLYSDSSQSNRQTFRMGSVALKLLVEFNPGGNLNDFFDDQFVAISELTFDVTVAGDGKTTLEAKPGNFNLGKQYGEILLLYWNNFQ